MSVLSIWDQILGRIEAKVGRHSFHTWFKPTSLLADEGGRVAVRVPNLLFTEWLPKHYSVVLTEALRDVGRPEAEIVFVPEEAKGSSSVIPRASAPPEDDPVQPGTTVVGLNPRYTFETFIVGPSNQFAHAACRAVSEAPSRSYNPLFIYGGVGLGRPI
jgi:chromosomal replication initiator protein